MPGKPRQPQKRKAAPKAAPAVVLELSPKHQAFVEHVIQGDSELVAYQKAYGCTRATAESNSWRLREHEGIRKAIEAGRQESWGEAVLSLQQKRAWLKMVIETPPGEVDENSTLCQEWHYETKGGGARGRLRRGNAPEGNEVEEEPVDTVKVKMPDKRACIELDAKLAGELAGDKASEKQAVAMSELTAAIKTIGDIMHGRP